MRQSDIFTVVIVAGVGTLAAFFLCNWLLGNPDDRYVTFKTIEVIAPSIAQPDTDVYNAASINPTVEVYIGNCVDEDQDGQLSRAELVVCGRVDGDRKSENEEGGEQEIQIDAYEETTETNKTSSSNTRGN